MIELTAQQVAEGWIKHDGKGFPAAALAFEYIESLEACGDIENAQPIGVEQGVTRLWDWFGTRDAPRAYCRIAWRPSSAAKAASAPEATAPDPNAAMIDRDGAALTFEDRVTALAGNGCIFGAPRLERCNLLTVAPITASGSSLWGA